MTETVKILTFNIKSISKLHSVKQYRPVTGYITTFANKNKLYREMPSYRFSSLFIKWP